MEVFLLLVCSNQRAVENKHVSGDGDAEGQEGVAVEEVNLHEYDGAEASIIHGVEAEDDQTGDEETEDAEKAVDENEPIEKRFGSLLQQRVNKGYIGYQN